MEQANPYERLSQPSLSDNARKASKERRQVCPALHPRAEVHSDGGGIRPPLENRGWSERYQVRGLGPCQHAPRLSWKLATSFTVGSCPRTEDWRPSSNHSCASGCRYRIHPFDIPPSTRSNSSFMSRRNRSDMIRTFGFCKDDSWSFASVCDAIVERL